MACNVKKCKVMRSTKKRQPLVSNYSLDNSFLEEVKEFKDLGVTTTYTFIWNIHIDIIVSKANRMLGLIKRTCRGLDDTKTLRTLLHISLTEYSILVCCMVTLHQKVCRNSWKSAKKSNQVHFKDWGQLWDSFKEAKFDVTKK